MDVEDNKDDVCDRNCRRCGFGVNFVKNCVGRARPPNVSRSGNDFEYFSSEADLLYNSASPHTHTKKQKERNTNACILV